MTKRVELYTSLPRLEELTVKAHGRGKNVTLPKRALLNLIMDHGTMTARLEELDQEPGYGRSEL